MINRWQQAFSPYLRPQVLGILVLGFSSGLPFLLTLGTLHVWLKEVGVSKTTIGLFAFATIPYACKFLWAPLIDHFRLPVLSDRFGQRRSWMLASQIALMVALVLLGQTNPAENIMLTGLATFLVAVCAATQDNVIEAYRIEALSRKHTGPGASTSVIGFRIGMWVSGGGALYLSAAFPWSTVYIIMASFVCIGMLATMFAHEPSHVEESMNDNAPKPIGFSQKFIQIVLPSLKDFFLRPDWIIILPFIVLFKVGDSVLNMMSTPFLLEVGFSNVEIAHIAKTFGFFAMILGGAIGGVLLMRYHIVHNLILAISLLIFSSIMFMSQASIGYHLSFLVVTMGVENIACGFSATVLISYLSQLCYAPNTATHFAILSSFSSFSRIGLSMSAGWIADSMNWVDFYALVAFACFPCLMLLIVFSNHFAKAIHVRPVSI
jgi:PAT family beta-lactamase induction signal transducer AmpG